MVRPASAVTVDPEDPTADSQEILDEYRIPGASIALVDRGRTIWGRQDLVEGWRENLDRYHRDERAELGKAHGGRAREIERGWHKFYRSRLVDAERSAWAVRERLREHQETGERESGPTSSSPFPSLAGPEAPSVAGEGSSDEPPPIRSFTEKVRDPFWRLTKPPDNAVAA